MILKIIRESLSGINYKECLLFGSQARGKPDSNSNYDILIVVYETVSPQEKFDVIDKIHDKIAPYLIPVDIIVKSVDEVEREKHLRGSIVRNALAEAVPL